MKTTKYLDDLVDRVSVRELRTAHDLLKVRLAELVETVELARVEILNVHSTLANAIARATKGE